MFSRGSTMSGWQEAPGEGARGSGPSRGGFRSRATTSTPGQRERGISFAPGLGEPRLDEHFESVINGTHGMLQLSSKMQKSGRLGRQYGSGGNPFGVRPLGLGPRPGSRQ